VQDQNGTSSSDGKGREDRRNCGERVHSFLLLLDREKKAPFLLESGCSRELSDLLPKKKKKKGRISLDL